MVKKGKEMEQFEFQIYCTGMYSRCRAKRSGWQAMSSSTRGKKNKETRKIILTIAMTYERRTVVRHISIPKKLALFLTYQLMPEKNLQTK